MVYSIGDSRSTKFVQMMMLGWPLTFLWLGQICIAILLYLENVENLFSETVLKTNGWNLQCMIKVVELFTIKISSPGSYTPLPLGYVHVENHVIFKVFFSPKPLDQISPDFTWSFLSKGYCKNNNNNKRTIKNLLLQKQENFVTVSWHVIFGTQSLPSLFRWWSMDDIWPFYNKVKYASPFKMLKNRFLKIYCRLMAETYTVWLK